MASPASATSRDRAHAAIGDYDVPGGQRLEPDLIVAPDASVGRKRLAGPALLEVEIASPGSRLNDTVTKRAAYAEAGVSAYWIVEPTDEHLLALRLLDSGYEVYAEGDGPVSLSWPTSVSFSVGDWPSAEIAARPFGGRYPCADHRLGRRCLLSAVCARQTGPIPTRACSGSPLRRWSRQFPHSGSALLPRPLCDGHPLAGEPGRRRAGDDRAPGVLIAHGPGCVEEHHQVAVRSHRTRGARPRV